MGSAPDFVYEQRLQVELGSHHPVGLERGTAHGFDNLFYQGGEGIDLDAFRQRSEALLIEIDGAKINVVAEYHIVGNTPRDPEQLMW
ncbi:hypothetical protein D3C71_1791080 [compost metagenome]